jgi:hypothetical protein
MNGRQFSFGISGHPLAQILAAIVMGVVLVAAVFMGAFLLIALLGLAVIGYVVFGVRAWWHSRSRTPGGRRPSGRGPGPGPAKAIRYIEGEFEVVEADSDAARRRRSDNR